MTFSTHTAYSPKVWGKGRTERNLAEEVAVAIVVNATTVAVMMATPADLDAFGVGFVLTEGIIETAADVQSVEIVDHDLGIEVRLWIEADKARALAERRRYQAGPTGCGLCGIESLEAAMRDIAPITARLPLSADHVREAAASLRPAQTLNAITHAVHAAALWHPERGLLAICEDVGRHNALDKLAGRAARMGVSAGECAVLLTSRVSIELIQKTARLGAPVLIAVSAPTRLAVRAAENAGLTLIGVVRDDGHEIYT